MVKEFSADEVMMEYRMLLAEEGEAADPESPPLVQGQRASKTKKKRRGYSREEIEKILEKNGKLSRAQMLRCKTRYFTDGMVIGSKSFVNGFFKQVKESLAGDRQIGAKPMRRLAKLKPNDSSQKIETGKLYSFRDLQKNVYG